MKGEVKAVTEFIGDISARLTWKDLSVMVTLGNGDTQTLLEDLTGYAEPGTLTAIMGPSGSGKSTLLDTLACRLATNAFLSGQILLNGMKTKLSFGTAAYVTPDDNLIGTLTVRETIMYSAKLRLPDKMATEEKRALVEGTILEMGLQDCADTVIGNWHLRGISGGEKRRVSIALEILMRPRLLFLDEPTSGLDSASAFFVTQTLRSLSRNNRTVVASIHQPSSEVFELFDRLYLLAGGKTVYFGQVSEACEFETSDEPLNKITTAEAIRRLTEFYTHSQYCYAARDKVDEISRVKGTVLDSGGSQASFLIQTCTLTKRSFVNMSRDFGYYWLRLVIYILVTIAVVIVYSDVGTGFDSFRARSLCIAFIFVFVTFMSIGGFPSFIEDMKVFQRERLNGHYGVAAFVISNTLSAMPFLMMISFFSTTICHSVIGSQQGYMYYLYFLVGFYVNISVVESLMMAIASVVPNFLMGVIVGAGIQGIFILICGFFQLPNDIPKVFGRYPMTHISFYYWSFQGQSKNHFQGLVINNESLFFREFRKISGDYLLKNILQVNVHRSKWVDLAVTCSMVAIYRIIFFVMIKISDDVTPWIRGYIARRRQEMVKKKN